MTKQDEVLKLQAKITQCRNLKKQFTNLKDSVDGAFTDGVIDLWLKRYRRAEQRLFTDLGIHGSIYDYRYPYAIFDSFEVVECFENGTCKIAIKYEDNDSEVFEWFIHLSIFSENNQKVYEVSVERYKEKIEKEQAEKKEKSETEARERKLERYNELKKELNL